MTTHPGPTGTNLAGLRDHNAALVLGLLRAAPEGGSRVGLAARTGLTPQAIGKITARLLAEGMIEEASPERLHRRQAPHPAPAARRSRLRRRRPPRTRRTHRPARRPDRPPPPPAHPAGGGGHRPRRRRPPGRRRDPPCRRGPAGGARLLGAGIGCRGPLDHAAGVLHWFTPA
ncbi:hypothetical protein ACFQ1I_06760 [Kitasatospora arboriphila]